MLKYRAVDVYLIEIPIYRYYTVELPLIGKGAVEVSGLPKNLLIMQIFLKAAGVLKLHSYLFKGFRKPPVQS
jgi:hypothetical protein